jgi:hypothetical protein
MILKPNYIEGIHNYCDRWCERCQFTSRCNVYEDTTGLSPEEQDINNQKFWENLASIMAETRAMIEKDAAERGIDLRAIVEAEGDNYEREHKRLRQSSREHPLGSLSFQYVEHVHEWITKSDGTNTVKDSLLQSHTLGLVSDEAIEANVKVWENAMAVIQWYEHFIHVKLMRSLMSRESDLDELDEFPKDSDGSAKVSMIAIERSMQAWATLLKLFPQLEDDILPNLGLLEKLLRITEQEFPQARSFVRPGFDTQT